MSATSVETRVQTFVTALTRRKLEGSYNVARETAEILRAALSRSKFGTISEVLEGAKELGKRLQEAQPLEFAIGNVVRRTLFIVREEFTNLSKKMSLSRPTLMNTSTVDPEEYEKQMDKEMQKELKNAVLASLTELIEEFSNIETNIADQAIDHIHANEVIMTFGGSKTVLAFLKAAGKKRKFEVVVAQSAPSCKGHKLSLDLAQCGIQTTLIPDSNVFAIMARVNKVIVGTHAVMANGGLIASSGTHNVALAAKFYNVPFVVCTGLYKLCPLYAFDQDTFNDIKSPSDVLEFDADTSENVQVQNPAFDYIPPELVTLYVTNYGGHNPSYIYRLLSEYYSLEDTLE